MVRSFRSLLPALPLLALGTGCAGSPQRAMSPAPMASPMAVSSPTAPSDEGALREKAVSMTSDTLLSGSFSASGSRSRASVLSSLPGLTQGSSGGGIASTPAAVRPVTAPQGVREMLAVEAHVTVEVERVADAVVKVHDLIAKSSGQLINDVYNDARTHQSSALSIRIPAAQTRDFLLALNGLGRIRERRVTGTDVGKQFSDQSILQRNLEITMGRYEELLKTAKDTKDLLAIEAELTRVRTQLDRVKSDLSSLGDRVERSTIYLSLQPIRNEPPSVYDPEAHFYPDLHGTYLHDLQDKSGFVGGGVGVRVSRAFGADISALRHAYGPFKRDLLIATMGGEVYSDFLGGGRRKFGNVFLGARAGVLYGRGRTEALVPITVGIELFHDKTVTVETRLRGDILFASSRGAHLAVQPDLGVAFAF